MMTDKSAQNQAAVITIAEAVLEDYFAQLPVPLDADASKEWKRLRAYLARRKQAILHPAPPKPRKPKAATGRENAAQSTLTVIDTPTGLRITEDSKLKTGRNGR